MRLFRTSVVSVAPVLLSLCPLRLLRSLRLPNGDQLHPCRLPRRVPTALAVAALMCTAAAAPGQQRGATSRGRAAVASGGPAGEAAAPLVLDQVTVIDVEHGGRLRDQRVVVVGNRIRALGPRRTVQVPAGARLVNARGKYLIPGLWDMHVHPSYPYVDDQLEAVVYRRTSAVYGQLIANGITGIRDASSWIPLDTFRVWKREIAAGRRVGPRLIVSGQAIDDNRSPCRRRIGVDSVSPTAHHTCVTGPEDGRHLVDSLQAAGADMIKMYELSPATYFAMAAEARRIGIPFGGHISAAISDTATLNGLIASDSGAVILDHELWASACGAGSLVGRDTVMSVTTCAAAAARLRRNNTWLALWMATQTATAGPLLAVADPKFLPRAIRYAGPQLSPDLTAWQPLSAAERRRLPTAADWLAALGGDSVIHGVHCQHALLWYAVDLPIVPGQDWPYGWLGAGVHLSMQLPVLCGVPPLWALQTATLNPARALHATDSLGTVAVGKIADLVLLGGDPLEDIWNVSRIEAVVANGHYFDRPALDRLLTAATVELHQMKVAMMKAQEKLVAPKQP